MSEHHKDSSLGVARAIFEGMPPSERAEVAKEADAKGVDPLEIVRASLDVLIEESGRASAPRVVVKPAR